MAKTPAKAEMYDEHKSKEKDRAAGHGKSELGSLQHDEATEKGHHMGEHLNAKLEDSEYGRHGMRAHMGHAMKHLKKEGDNY